MLQVVLSIVSVHWRHIRPCLNFEIQIIDKLSDVTDKQVDAAIDNYAMGQRNK